MRLYSFFRSSAAYPRAHRAELEGRRLRDRRRRICRAARTARPSFVALNPQATIPTLDDDGTILWQSLAIIEYLDARFPEPRLIPLEPVDACARAGVGAADRLRDPSAEQPARAASYLRGELKLDEAAVSKWYSHWIAEAFGSLETLRRALERRPLLLRRRAVARRRLPRAADVQRAALRLRSRAVSDARAHRADARAEPAFARAAPELQPDAT